MINHNIEPINGPFAQKIFQNIGSENEMWFLLRYAVSQEVMRAMPFLPSIQALVDPLLVSKPHNCVPPRRKHGQSNSQSFE